MSDLIYRLSKVAAELNVSTDTIIQELNKKGTYLDREPNSKISENDYIFLSKLFDEESNERKERELLRSLANKYGYKLVPTNGIKGQDDSTPGSYSEADPDFDEIDLDEDMFLDTYDDYDNLDIPNPEEEIMRALRNGDGELYGY